MQIIIDADACPVKEIIIEESQSFNLPVHLVSSYDHFSNHPLPSHVQSTYVEKGPDAADFKVLALAEAGDLVVSQDYGLASLLLPKKVAVLHHKGFFYTKENINQLLQDRHYSALARKAGVRTKGPKALSDNDRRKFRQVLIDYLRQKAV